MGKTDKLENIIQLDVVRIERKRPRKCTCNNPKFTIDTANREVTCECGIVFDPFEVLLHLARNLEMINEQHKALNEQRQQWLKEKPHSVLFKRLEQNYQRGKMFPLCPNCEMPFDFQEITSFVNAEFFVKRRTKDDQTD